MQTDGQRGDGDVYALLSNSMARLPYCVRMREIVPLKWLVAMTLTSDSKVTIYQLLSEEMQQNHNVEELFSEEMQQNHNVEELFSEEMELDHVAEEPSTVDQRNRHNIDVATRAALTPIVSMYFDMITPTQWTLLSAGILSPDLEKTLSEMITHITNKLCKDLVCTTLVTCKGLGYISEEALQTVLNMFNLQTEDSLPGSFEEVLNVPAEECLENLTQLIQQEVSENLMDWVTEETDENNPKEINFPMSTLPQMILSVTTYLKKVAAKLEPPSLRVCCSPDSRKSEALDKCGSHQSDDVPAPNLSDTLDDILAQHSDLKLDLEEKETHSDVCFHSPDEWSPEPCCNMDGLFQSVKDFFTRPVLTTDKTGFALALKRHIFCNFANKKFVKMFEDIKSAIKQTGKVASLPQGVSDEKTKEEYVLAENTLPAWKSEPCIGGRATPVVDMRKVHLGIIQNRSDALRHIHGQHVGPATNGQCIREKINAEIHMFSKDLANKFYGHLMGGHIYKIPMTGMGRSLSDSVVYRVRRLEDSMLHHCSPEVLYNITEHFMVKFLNDLNIFWMDDKVRHAEEVSAQNQIRDTQTPRVSPFEPIDTEECEQEPELSLSLESEEEDDMERLPTTSSLVNSVIYSLLMIIIKKAPRKTKRLVENMDIFSIISRLSEVVKGEIINPVSFRQMKKRNKAVIKGLIKDFGSEKKMIAALLLNDGSFDAAVVKQFKIRQNRPTQKNPVSRFFLALGKTLAIPFRMCIECSSDD
ncbi:hypothetical protein GBF38_002554 [Nibea albiflora]|uniref:Uncharacterized protein n=1 Tax=Nibea albiflora TaxID=240163 RepID=A0ACB7EES0_NIBAL|nr:hypothetical protein GBF38_002554 [Nibea albiflora]